MYDNSAEEYEELLRAATPTMSRPRCVSDREVKEWAAAQAPPSGNWRRRKESRDPGCRYDRAMLLLRRVLDKLGFPAALLIVGWLAYEMTGQWLG